MSNVVVVQHRSNVVIPCAKAAITFFRATRGRRTLRRPLHASDPSTLLGSVLEAQANLVLAGSEQKIEEAVADKGYHKAGMLAECEQWNTRTYIPEPKRKKYNWEDKPEAWRKATTANRRRVRGHEVSDCRRSEVSWWSGALLMSARRGVDGGRGCEVC
jgi:hypothetical protein